LPSGELMAVALNREGEAKSNRKLFSADELLE